MVSVRSVGMELGRISAMNERSSFIDVQAASFCFARMRLRRIPDIDGTWIIRRTAVVSLHAKL